MLIQRIAWIAALWGFLSTQVAAQASPAYDFLIELTSTFKQTYWVWGAENQSYSVIHPLTPVDNWNEQYGVSSATTVGATGGSTISFSFANGELMLSSAQAIAWPGYGQEFLNHSLYGVIYVRGSSGTVVDVEVEGSSSATGGGWAAGMFFPAEHQNYPFSGGAGGSFGANMTRVSQAVVPFGGVEYSVLSTFELNMHNGGILQGPLLHECDGQIQVSLKRRDPPSKLCIYSRRKLTASPPSSLSPGHAFVGLTPGFGPSAGEECLIGFRPTENPIIGPGYAGKEKDAAFNCRICFDIDTEAYLNALAFINAFNASNSASFYEFISSNCVNFVQGVASAAGVSLPPAVTLGLAADPSVLADEIAQLPGAYCQDLPPFYQPYLESLALTASYFLEFALSNPISAGAPFNYPSLFAPLGLQAIAAGDELRIDVQPSTSPLVANPLGAAVVSWGDGTVSGFEPPFEHHYAAEGTYSIRVLTVDAGGFQVFDGTVLATNGAPTGNPTDVQVILAQTPPVPYLAQPIDPTPVPALPLVQAISSGCALTGSTIPVLTASMPTLGQAMAITVDSGNQASGILFMGGVGPSFSLGQYGIGCETALELGSIAPLVSFITNSEGVWSVQFHLPFVAALSGQEFGIQALTFAGMVPVGITQTVRLVLGY